MQSKCVTALGMIVVMSLARSALAETPDQVVQPVTTLRTNASAQVESRLLKIEPSFWDTFGVRITRNGEKVGPSLFEVISDDVVRGSSAAEGHAHHARVYQGLVLGFGAIGVGLLAAGVGTRSAGTEWTTTSRGLVAGGVVSILVQGIMAAVRENELAAAVSAYNADLVRGTLSE